MYTAIDLFAGIGGTRKGFNNAFKDDIKTIYVSEIDLSAQETYRANFHDNFDIIGDIKKVEAKEIPDFDICLAGFPCQTVSEAGRNDGFGDAYYKKNNESLFFDIVRICDFHKPKVIFCENVKGLTTHDKGRTFRIITETLEGLGYKVYYEVLNSKDFGVPQNRERLYIVCFRNDVESNKFKFPKGKGKTGCIKDILEDRPVSSKYYLSKDYLESLKKRNEHYKKAGFGFGYKIRDIDGIAGTLVAGSLERNLIIDPRIQIIEAETVIKGLRNSENIRKMTPREWARLQGFQDDYKLVLPDNKLYRQLANSATINVIEAIAKEIKVVLEASANKKDVKGKSSKKNENEKTGNKGEWSELYAVIKIIADGRIYLAGNDGYRNQSEWMDVISLRRIESVKKGKKTIDREVRYQIDSEMGEIDIQVDDNSVKKIDTTRFQYMAELLKNIISGSKGTFSLSAEAQAFLSEAEIIKPKAKSVNKSDIFVTLRDPRASIIREDVGFSIKSEFGEPPSIFNTAKASAAKYKLSGMSDALMDEINSLMDNKNHVAVTERIKRLRENGCKFEFIGYPVAQRARCKAFSENLDTLDSKLPELIERIMWNHFIEGETVSDIPDVVESLIRQNPLNHPRPEIKYPVMIKRFLYAGYCGMTASTLWKGENQVNGGLINVNKDGEIMAYYALESDSFNNFLYKNCFVDYPATDSGHGDYAKVYKENEEYYFHLNFQIKMHKGKKR